MADFQQTMRDWRRMCKTYTTYDDDESCCDGCPIMKLAYSEHSCDAIFSDWAKSADWQDVETIITQWAAEHPEPKYPTWREWLIGLGVISFRSDFNKLVDPATTVTNVFVACLNDKASEPISAEIAQKLGLKPKEG